MRSQHVARGLAAWLLVPLLASGCALLIPENPSTARYNKVIGERRIPQENMKTMQGMGPQSSTAAPVMPVAQAPIVEQQQIDTSPTVAPAPVASMDLPPVDPMTQRIAAERMEAAARSVPSENMQTASNDYPQLNQVPPAPARSGPDSDAERLRAVREQLERDRAAASATTQQVRDAAAREPSILGPNGTVPAPEPIMSTPVPAPQTYNAPVNVPAAPRIADLPPPPTPAYSAPAPQVASAPAPIQMDAMPMPAPAPAMNTAAMEPIVLRPPVVATPAPAFVPSAPAPAPAYRSMPPAAGSFDPMAGATASYSGSNGYLPASRYRR